MITRKILQVQYPFLKSIRTFLSKNYKCVPEWELRLQSPLLQKIKLDSFYYEIDQTFNQHGKVSAIDIDLFVNKVIDDSHNDEVIDIIHRLRKTEETTNALNSTSHAVIRNFYDNNHTDDLIEILSNPLVYGVFLDDYIANYIMNDCIEKKNYKIAARIATFLMLQENFSNDLTKNLALYSCYKYLTNPEPFFIVEEKPNNEQKEEIKVRVKYLRNEFFDDHFDLKNNKHLVGKTLSMIGSEMNDSIGINLQILGYVLYQKYEKVLILIEKTPKSSIYKDVLEKCIKFLNEEKEEKSEEHLKVIKFINEILNNKNYITDDFENKIEKLVRESVSKNEENEIKCQKETYKYWTELREKRFNEELERLNRAQRIKKAEQMLKEMDKEEQKLWFFENEEKIDLEIDNKKVLYPKKELEKRKKSKDTDENYIPPEIRRQRK